MMFTRKTQDTCLSRRLYMLNSLLIVLLSTKIFGSDDLPGNAEPKIKMYALYTPSHKVLLDDWFLPSIKDDYEVIVEFIDIQEGEGTFRATDWFQAIEKKVELIIQATQENLGRIFIFSDVDITFYRPTWPHIAQALEGYDMVFQRDTPNGVICTGFFACRAHERTLAFWREIQLLMRNHQGRWHDQTAVNHLLRRNCSTSTISWDYLPPEFLSGGTLTGRKWRSGRPLPVPSGIILHHANFTKGVANKIKQLTYVKNIVEAR